MVHVLERLFVFQTIHSKPEEDQRNDLKDTAVGARGGKPKFSERTLNMDSLDFHWKKEKSSP